MEFNDLTDEQKAKVKACKTADELIALAKSEGVELSDEQLNSIAGGDSFWCPTASHRSTRFAQAKDHASATSSLPQALRMNAEREMPSFLAAASMAASSKS